MIRWRGIHKLQEEMAELSVELAKLCVRPDGHHWDEADGKLPLLERLENEMGDVLAALDYFMNRSTVFDQLRIERRRADKLLLFREWKLSGIEDGGAGTVATSYETLRAAVGVMAGSPADAVADTEALYEEITGESLDEVASVRNRVCRGAECPRDGECPEHGKDRPGQCVSVATSWELLAELPKAEPEDGDGRSRWLGRGSRD